MVWPLFRCLVNETVGYKSTQPTVIFMLPLVSIPCSYAAVHFEQLTICCKKVSRAQNKEQVTSVSNLIGILSQLGKREIVDQNFIHNNIIIIFLVFFDSSTPAIFLINLKFVFRQSQKKYKRQTFINLDRQIHLFLFMFISQLLLY